VLAGLLVLIGVGLFFMARSLLSQPLVTVPDVRNQPEASAKNILRSNGFEIGEVTHEPSDSVPKGSVIDYNPKQAHDGDAIALIVSAGPETAEVPRVICEDEATARSDLESKGFVVKLGPERSNDACPTEGLVADQDPNPGEMAPVKSTVRIFLNPPPPPTPSPSPSPSPSPPPPSPSSSPSESPSP
jgi:serine/threonine-protein kinase